MKRALVLSAGASWAAYQIGALRHLVGTRGLRFDLVAATGIGAMNAALVACGRFDALDRFWQDLGWRRLLRPNLRHPWREGPLVPGPQRAFLERFVSEARLRETGCRLRVSALDLQTGRLEVSEFPGASSRPLVDALLGAASFPGVTPPGRGGPDGQHQVVEATMVHGFPIRAVLDEAWEEIYAIGAAPVRPGRAEPGVRYPHWRAVMDRAMKLNQSHDVWQGLREARERIEALRARAEVARAVPETLADRVSDPAVRERLRARLTAVYSSGAFPHAGRPAPALYAVTPSEDLRYPLWRFRKSDLARAAALGERDAREVAP